MIKKISIAAMLFLFLFAPVVWSEMPAPFSKIVEISKTQPADENGDKVWTYNLNTNDDQMQIDMFVLSDGIFGIALVRGSTAEVVFYYDPQKKFYMALLQYGQLADRQEVSQEQACKLAFRLFRYLTENKFL